MSQNVAIVDKLLTNASSMYQPEGFISESLFPVVKVTQTTGKLAKYTGQHLRVESSVVAGRGAFRRVEAIVRSNSTYSVDRHGLESLITKDDYRNVEKPYDAELDEVMGLTNQLFVEKEIVLATALSDTSVITQTVTLSGTSQFNDYDNSDPLARFSTARLTVKTGSGMFPNCAWMDSYTMNYLRFHPQMLDNLGYKYARSGGLSDDELARALMVKKVLVSDVSYNSAAEGQTDTLASAWGKHIWFGVCPDTAQVRQLSAGYRLEMAGEQPRQVTKYSVNNPPGSTGITCEDSYGFLIANATAIYLIKDAVA